jgi:hypothetical protein
MRDRVESIARDNGEAREGLLVAALCSSHEIDVHASPVGRPHGRGMPFTAYGRDGRGPDSIFV